MLPRAEINTGISDTTSLLDIQEALAYLMRCNFGVYLSAEFVAKRHTGHSFSSLPIYFFFGFFFPPVKVESHFWRTHGQVVILTAGFGGAAARGRGGCRAFGSLGGLSPF